MDKTPITSLITLNHQTVPVNAISMMSLSRQPASKAALMLGVVALLVAAPAWLDAVYDPHSVASPWVLAGIAAIGALVALRALPSVAWPRFYLSLQLHSGSTVVITLPNERDARAAELDVQSAMEFGQPRLSTRRGASTARINRPDQCNLSA